MNKKRLWIYILFSFLPVWIGALLYVLCGNKYSDDGTQLLMIFAMLCPTIAVFLTKKITKDDTKLVGDASLDLGISFKGKKKWWILLGILLPVVYCEVGYILYYGLYPQAFDFAIWDTVGVEKNMLWLMPIALIISSVTYSFAGLGEEIGWRGYMYPLLEKMMGESKAVIVGGIIWGVWHYPLLYMGHNFGTDYLGAPWLGFLVFTIYCIAVGQIFYFIKKKTKSVWIAGFMHAIHNSVASMGLFKMALTREGAPSVLLELPIECLFVSIPMILLGMGLWLGIFLKNRKLKITS